MCWWRRSKKNRWTNETASIKILSFFSCEIRMRCLRNHCLHCCQVRPVLTDSQLLQKYRVSSLFLRLRLSPSLSRRSLHFLWKELFSLERSRWVVCLSARNSTENAMTDLSVRARHRRHAAPARERNRFCCCLLQWIEMKWNEMKIKKAVYVYACVRAKWMRSQALHGYIRLWRWWKVIDLHQQPTAAVTAAVAVAATVAAENYLFSGSAVSWIKI